MKHLLQTIKANETFGYESIKKNLVINYFDVSKLTLKGWRAGVNIN